MFVFTIWCRAPFGKFILVGVSIEVAIPFEQHLSCIRTPAFIYDEGDIIEKINGLSAIIDRRKCSLLFPLKTFCIMDALYTIAPLVDGFSASSLFEARLARKITGVHKMVNIVTPAIRPGEIDQILELCDHVILNSMNQWQAYRRKIGRAGAEAGLRVNPQLSFVREQKDNPCRKYSKLGIPIDHLLNADRDVFQGISGLHFHTNSESVNFRDLLQTVKHIESNLAELFDQIDWINLGGGYLYHSSRNTGVLVEIIDYLKSKYDLEIFMEPGKGIIGSSGYMVSTVLDIFENEGKNIAILDTTVNHMPEVFEYQNSPAVAGHSEEGLYAYLLAGTTCLAGDLFGEYKFNRPLSAGSTVVFTEMGAYTMVKAQLFNGINLPSIYACKKSGELELKKEYSYEEFKLRSGGRLPKM